MNSKNVVENVINNGSKYFREFENFKILSNGKKFTISKDNLSLLFDNQGQLIGASSCSNIDCNNPNAITSLSK